MIQVVCQVWCIENEENRRIREWRRKIVTLPPSYTWIPDSTRIPLVEKDLGSSRERSAIDGCCLGWRKTFKRTIIHDVPRVTTNSTVAVGANNVCMSPVTTEVTPDHETKMSGMAGHGRVTMRTGIVWTIFVIVAIMMTVEADCVGWGEGNVKTVWAREDIGGRRKKVLSLKGEGLWMVDRNGDGLDMVLTVRIRIRFYSCGSFSRRGRG